MPSPIVEGLLETDVELSTVPNAKQSKGKGKGRAPAHTADDVEAMVKSDWEGWGLVSSSALKQTSERTSARAVGLF